MMFVYSVVIGDQITDFIFDWMICVGSLCKTLRLHIISVDCSFTARKCYR